MYIVFVVHGTGETSEHACRYDPTTVYRPYEHLLCIAVQREHVTAAVGLVSLQRQSSPSSTCCYCCRWRCSHCYDTRHHCHITDQASQWVSERLRLFSLGCSVCVCVCVVECN